MPPGSRSASRTSPGRRSRPLGKYIARLMNLRITLGRKNRTVNPTRYGKPKRSSSEQDARSVALGRSLVIRLDPDWEAQLEEMNRSKRGRPFAYPDLLMGSISYLRYMIGKGVRIMEGVTDKMLGNGVKGPDHVTIWRRTYAQAVSIKGDRITIQTTDDKMHVLVADSTGITTPARLPDLHLFHYGSGGRLHRYNHHRQGQVDRDQVERKVQLHQAAHTGR